MLKTVQPISLFSAMSSEVQFSSQEINLMAYDLYKSQIAIQEILHPKDDS